MDSASADSSPAFQYPDGAKGFQATTYPCHSIPDEEASLIQTVHFSLHPSLCPTALPPTHPSSSCQLPPQIYPGRTGMNTHSLSLLTPVWPHGLDCFRDSPGMPCLKVGFGEPTGRSPGCWATETRAAKSSLEAPGSMSPWFCSQSSIDLPSPLADRTSPSESDKEDVER